MLHQLQGSKTVYIFAYALAYTSKKLGVRMCIGTLFVFVNGFPLGLFLSLGNATFAIFAMDVPIIPVTHI